MSSIVAVKAGLSFVAILLISGIVQTQSVADPILLFATAGLIPGTNIEVSPELMLVIAAAALMTITLLLHRQYTASHAALEAVLPEYEHHKNEEEWRGVGDFVPRLRRLALVIRSVMYVTSEVSKKVYVSIKSLRRPIIAQTRVLQDGLIVALIRLDRAVANFNLDQKVDTVGLKVYAWADGVTKVVGLYVEKVRAYFMSMTLR
ncbi:MAG TPA: hypothetical protein VIS56_00695 [Candidatus Saccharimonadales bacterium]